MVGRLGLKQKKELEYYLNYTPKDAPNSSGEERLGLKMLRSVNSDIPKRIQDKKLLA